MYYEVCKIINIYRDLINCSQKPEISLVPIGMVWAIFSNFSLVQHLDQNFSYFDQLLLQGFEISTSIIIGDDVLKFRNMERTQKCMLPDLIFVIFSPQMYFLGSIFLHMKARKVWQNSPKFLNIWRNFQFPHNCHTWKVEISPHDNFFFTNIIRDIRGKYELWV